MTGKPPTRVRPKPPGSPYHAAAQDLLRPWWAQFKTEPILPYVRVLKTVMAALEHGIHPDVITAGMKILGDERKPVTPGMLQMAISRLPALPVGHTPELPTQPTVDLQAELKPTEESQRS